MFVFNKSKFDIDYINKMSIFELIPLVKVLKNNDK